MRRASILSTAVLIAVGATALAGACAAQTPASAGEARGLRYLSWSGRGSVTEPSATVTPDRPTPARRDLRRPNTVIPHGGSVPTPLAPPAPVPRTAGAEAVRTLTPANAWMQRRALPPEPPAPTAPTAAPVSPPAPRTRPDYLPDQGGRGQPVPADIAYAPPPAPPAPEAQADPMAPRRDAPIFRMQSNAPIQPAPPEARPAVREPAASPPSPQPSRVANVVNTGERPPQQGARYYSVHRQNGRQPDALEMPEPTYVDALSVNMVETIASQDLAEPAPPPTFMRDAEGRLRPVAAPADGDYQ